MASYPAPVNKDQTIPNTALYTTFDKPITLVTGDARYQLQGVPLTVAGMTVNGPLTVNGTSSDLGSTTVGTKRCYDLIASASVSCVGLTSSSTMSCGTNAMTCGAITSSGIFSNGTNAMTCGAITSSGAININDGISNFGKAGENNQITLQNGTSYGQVCLALTSGIYSATALAGDTVIRSKDSQSLILQCGATSGTPTGAIRVNPSNNVEILRPMFTDAVTTTGTMSVSGSMTCGTLSSTGIVSTGAVTAATKVDVFVPTSAMTTVVTLAASTVYMVTVLGASSASVYLVTADLSNLTIAPVVSAGDYSTGSSGLAFRLQGVSSNTTAHVTYFILQK